MAQTVCVLLSAADRKRLEAIASDHNQPGQYGERARVVLASANGRPVQQVATEIAVSRPMVWRWQQRARFAEQGPRGRTVAASAWLNSCVSGSSVAALASSSSANSVSLLGG
jgi:Homeodomain-like domain